MSKKEDNLFLAKAKMDRGHHPSHSTLALYCQGEIGDETWRHVRVHLLYCDECFEAVRQIFAYKQAIRTLAFADKKEAI